MKKSKPPSPGVRNARARALVADAPTAKSLHNWQTVRTAAGAVDRVPMGPRWQRVLGHDVADGPLAVLACACSAHALLGELLRHIPDLRAARRALIGSAAHAVDAAAGRLREAPALELRRIARRFAEMPLDGDVLRLLEHDVALAEELVGNLRRAGGAGNALRQLKALHNALRQLEHDPWGAASPPCWRADAWPEFVELGAALRDLAATVRRVVPSMLQTPPEDATVERVLGVLGDAASRVEVALHASSLLLAGESWPDARTRLARMPPADREAARRRAQATLARWRHDDRGLDDFELGAVSPAIPLALAAAIARAKHHADASRTKLAADGLTPKQRRFLAALCANRGQWMDVAVVVLHAFKRRTNRDDFKCLAKLTGRQVEGSRVAVEGGGPGRQLRYRLEAPPS